MRSRTRSLTPRRRNARRNEVGAVTARGDSVVVVVVVLVVSCEEVEVEVDVNVVVVVVVVASSIVGEGRWNWVLPAIPRARAVS
jgi:hypothetical protein